MSSLFQEDSSSVNGPLAVIIEDDRDILDLFRQVVDLAGYRTELVLDGAEAIQCILKARPDIVLLDLQLPGMSGVEILQRMREDPLMANIPVVVITAYSRMPQNLAIEPDLLLQKPVDIHKLSRIVQRLKAAMGDGSQPALDPVTGLYAMPFFLVQLTFSLERIKQSMVKKFGVLFADVIQWEDISGEFSGRDLDDFQRRLADQFKGSLRPGDTMAWSDDHGYFLTLIEDVSSEQVPLKMARRVADDIRKYSGRYNSGLSLRVNLGVLVCDGSYEDALRIMKDIELARDLLRNKQFSSPAIFDRQMLHGSG